MKLQSVIQKMNKNGYTGGHRFNGIYRYEKEGATPIEFIDFNFDPEDDDDVSLFIMIYESDFGREVADLNTAIVESEKNRKEMAQLFQLGSRYEDDLWNMIHEYEIESENIRIPPKRGELDEFDFLELLPLFIMAGAEVITGSIGPSVVINKDHEKTFLSEVRSLLNNSFPRKEKVNYD